MTERRPSERSEAGLQRGLKIAIAAMGVMIVIGLGAIVFQLARMGPGGAARETTLTLPDGAAVRSLSLSGQRLAVHYAAPQGEGVAVLDVETGRVLSRIRVGTAAGGE